MQVTSLKIATGSLLLVLAFTCAKEVCVLAAAAQPVANITTERLLHADAAPGEWLTGGRDYRQNYYSPLTDINAGDIERLGFAWSYDIDPAVALEGTPIVVDGVMFTSSGGEGSVYSLDAGSGALRWSFRPQIDATSVHYPANRGVAVWGGKVFFAAGDGYLYALDAVNGALVWKANTILDRSHTYFSTGAPYIAGNVVVIGNGGGEYDSRGYVSAYDIATGKQKWRFFTVPGDPKRGFEHPELKMAAKTWDPASRWDLGGGGNAWDGMAYDSTLNLLYVGTGNGNPWNRNLRSPAGGDNLFLASILAINPNTGHLVWYYQTTPGDNLDYDAVQKMIIADLTIDGISRKVVMQANKNGFFYILDRATGKLLSAKPYVYINWASGIDPKTGRPSETGRTDYSKDPKLIFPSGWGGHNWQPMSYNPGTGLVYIPVLESGALFGPTGEPFIHQKGQWNIGAAYIDVDRETSDGDLPQGWPSLNSLRAGEPDPLPRIFLKAWDPIQQAKVWEVETTVRGAVTATRGDPSGVMSTASGLVFQAQVDGRLLIFDARTGERLRSIDVGSRIVAAPMTYRIGGDQYIALLGTNMTAASHTHDGGNSEAALPGRIVVLKLDGGEIPHPTTIGSESAPMPPVANTGTPAQVSLGRHLFTRHCAICHGSANRAPDLARLNAQAHREFLDIVLKGTRLSKGMPDFGARLSQDDAQAIRAFVTDLAWKHYHEVQARKDASANPEATCPMLKPAGEPLSLLIVTGGHPYEPAEFFATFAAFPGVRYQHVYMDSGNPIAVPPGGTSQQYDVVLFYDLELGAITPEWRKLFDRGRGVVFLHHALGSFPDSAQYEAMVGGRYIFPSEQHRDASVSTFHPNEHQHFTIIDRSHPITCAIGDFDMLDEAYDNIEVDPRSHVLMTSDVPKLTPATAWISGYTEKRVVYIQPGHGSLGLPLDHGSSSYQNEKFKELLDRAISWAAGRL